MYVKLVMLCDKLTSLASNFDDGLEFVQSVVSVSPVHHYDTVYETLNPEVLVFPCAKSM